MIERRGFLGWLGLSGSVSLGLGSVRIGRSSYSEAATPAPPSAEDLELRVYGGADYRDRRLLLTRRVPVRMECRAAVADWYGPPGLELVLKGPIVVTVVTIQTPLTLRFLRDEVALTSVHPTRVKDKGDTVTILLPERLFSVS